jgi:hypothetical protein
MTWSLDEPIYSSNKAPLALRANNCDEVRSFFFFFFFDADNLINLRSRCARKMSLWDGPFGKALRDGPLGRPFGKEGPVGKALWEGPLGRPFGTALWEGIIKCGFGKALWEGSLGRPFGKAL